MDEKGNVIITGLCCKMDVIEFVSWLHEYLSSLCITLILRTMQNESFEASSHMLLTLSSSQEPPINDYIIQLPPTDLWC